MDKVRRHLMSLPGTYGLFLADLLQNALDGNPTDGLQNQL
jgi:hypothetical protein